MQEKDIQIIVQNCNSAAAGLTAAMVESEGVAPDPQAVLEAYYEVHNNMVDHVLATIGSLMIQDQFPGSNVVPMQPAPAPAPAPSGPAAQPMPQPAPQQAPQVVPDHQILANAQPPQPVGPQGPGGHKDDALWMQLFENPGDWWDNRNDKKSPRHPDFKSKSIPDPKNPQYKLGLYISSAPQWAKDRLGVA